MGNLRRQINNFILLIQLGPEKIFVSFCHRAIGSFTISLENVFLTALCFPVLWSAEVITALALKVVNVVFRYLSGTVGCCWDLKKSCVQGFRNMGGSFGYRLRTSIFSLHVISAHRPLWFLTLNCIWELKQKVPV